MNLKTAIPSIETHVVTLNPEDCRWLLKNNSHNRHPARQTVQLYADQMKRGTWRLNGEPIIIADNGDVMDGQHRLLACIDADMSFETLIVYNIPRDTFDTIDTGRGRNGADVLTINGLSPETARICAAAAGLCIVFIKSGSIGQGSLNQYLITPSKRARWVEMNQSIIDIAEKIQSYGRSGRIMSAGELAFLWFFMESKNKECTEKFFAGFLSGAYLGENDPRLAMRQKLESFKNSRNRWNRKTKICAVIRSWNWFCRGKAAIYTNNMWRELDSALDLIR